MVKFRIPGRPWYRRVRRGFAAQPLSWEGWAFTGAYLVGLVAFAGGAGLLPPFTGGAPALLPFFGASGVLTGVYTVFVRLKSEDEAEPLPRPAPERVRVRPLRRNEDEWM